jgi:hypothetical protein
MHIFVCLKKAYLTEMLKEIYKELGSGGLGRPSPLFARKAHGEIILNFLRTLTHKTVAFCCEGPQTADGDRTTAKQLRTI